MRRFALITTGVVTLVLLAFLLLPRRAPSFGPPLTLPGGVQVRIAAITFGTNHVYGSALARFVTRLPAFPKALVDRLVGQKIAPPRVMNTTQPTLMIWLERTTNASTVYSPTNPGFLTTLLSDSNGFVSGADANCSIGPPWPEVDPVSFSAFPRRGTNLALEFYYHSQEEPRHVGRLPFRNPLPARTYSEWQPDPLPAVKYNNGVTAILNAFHTGHDNNTTYTSDANGSLIMSCGTNRIDGRNYSVVNLLLVATNAPGELWRAVNVELSDACGNVVRNNSMSSSGTDQTFAFGPSLWPSENPWKLKIEVKRTRGLLAEELVAFENVPLGLVGQTNRVAWTTNLGGIFVTLDEICRKPPMDENRWSSKDLSYVKLAHSPLPAGTHLDLISMVLDSGETNSSGGWTASEGVRVYNYRRFSSEARSATFTIAIQRSRFFEFMIKPELPGRKRGIEKH